MRRALTMLLLAGLLSAGAATAARSGGWQQHRAASGAFTLSTPATWVDFSRATPQLLARVKTAPKLQAYVDLVKKTKALKLLAVDMSPGRLATGFATNLNVAQVRTVGDVSLQAKATAAQLRGLGILVGAVHSRAAKIPAGPDSELRYRARYTANGAVVSITQFFLVHAGSVVILTYTTLPKFEAAYRPVFERSARSFRFLR